jgi:hypothetical protein
MYPTNLSYLHQSPLYDRGKRRWALRWNYSVNRRHFAMLTNDCTICLSYTRVNKEDRVASQFSKCKDRTV